MKLKDKAKADSKMKCLEPATENDMKVIFEGRSGFCTFCTADYQDEMKAVGSCKYPQVYFVKTKEGVVGRLPTENKKLIPLTNK